MLPRTVSLDDKPQTHDASTCPRCGDPLPLDRRCDCAGDPDRDRVAAYKGMDARRGWGYAGLLEGVRI